jgi:GNAT superfamily N-acetyltransferase
MAALTIRRGGADDAPRLLTLFDDAVAWLVARGQTGQWGSEPFSAQPRQVSRAQAWAAGGGLWLAVAVAADGRERTAGAIVLGEAYDYVPPPGRPELYVQVLLTAPAWRGRGVRAIVTRTLQTSPTPARSAPLNLRSRGRGRSPHGVPLTAHPPHHSGVWSVSAIPPSLGCGREITRSNGERHAC